MGGTTLKRRGFTLIELLVVIAIIAILAAILFPIFTNAKERGRQVKCCSNLKQLVIACQQYVDDNNGSMPFGVSSTPMPNPNDWAGSYYRYQAHPESGSLWKYTRNKRIYVCPTDQNVAAMDIWYGDGHPTKFPRDYALSYSMNSDMGSIPGTSGRTIKFESEIVGRSGKVMLFIHEGHGEEKKAGISGGFLGINDGWFSYRGTVADLPSGIHYDGTTCSYADGHAKWISYKEAQYETDIAHASQGCPDSDWLPNSLVAQFRQAGLRHRP